MVVWICDRSYSAPWSDFCPSAPPSSSCLHRLSLPSPVPFSRHLCAAVFFRSPLASFWASWPSFTLGFALISFFNENMSIFKTIKSLLNTNVTCRHYFLKFSNSSSLRSLKFYTTVYAVPVTANTWKYDDDMYTNYHINLLLLQSLIYLSRIVSE